MRPVLLLAAILLVIPGCATTKEILATSYEQSCQSDADCVAIRSGSCDPCGYPCHNEAINRRDFGAYERAFESWKCEREELVQCAACMPVVARCLQQRCVVQAN